MEGAPSPLPAPFPARREAGRLCCMGTEEAHPFLSAGSGTDFGLTR